MTTEDTALARFRQVYDEMRDKRAKVEQAAAWIIEHYAPYKIGETVTIPVSPPSLVSGTQITVNNIRLDCDPRSGAVLWTISGKAGGFRIQVGAEMPAARQPEQSGLF